MTSIKYKNIIQMVNPRKGQTIDQSPFVAWENLISTFDNYHHHQCHVAQMVSNKMTLAMNVIIYIFL